MRSPLRCRQNHTLAVALPLVEGGGSGARREAAGADPWPRRIGCLPSRAPRGVMVAVGHTERFNPALVAARPHLGVPRFIEVHRLGTFPERSLDIDVVFDLMIHDLDMILVDRWIRRSLPLMQWACRC